MVSRYVERPPLSLISYLQINVSYFFRATNNEATIMKNILATYEAPSGQSINFRKSKIFCNRNVHQDLRDLVVNILRARATYDADKYLGFTPTAIRERKRLFLVLSKKECSGRSILGVANVSYK